MDGLSVFIGFITGFILCFTIYVGFRRSTTMIIHYPDRTWFKGIRKWRYTSQETHGTHHFTVLDGSEEFKPLIGRRIAVPINSAKYFIIN